MVGYVGGQAMAVSSANGRVGNILIQSRDAQIKVEEVLEDMGIISSSKSIGGDRLISLNPDYDDIPLHDYDSIYCRGKVIGTV